MDEAEAIKLVNINKYFGTEHVLKNISFSVPVGGSIGILGPNGAGKSTLIKIIVGILPQTSGELWFKNEQFSDKPKHNCQLKKNIGYLPELPSLYPELRVQDLLKFMTRIREISDIQQEIKRVASLCSLESVLRSKIGHISKGFKQRLGLAQVLIGSPAILVLDEVASGLDPHQRVQITDLLRKEALAGKTIIFSTHSIEDAMQISDNIILLNEGQIAKKFVISQTGDNHQEVKQEIMKGFIG